MINGDFARSTPPRLAHISKSQISSKKFFFNNKGQISWAQKFTFLMDIYHAKCFSNLFFIWVSNCVFCIFSEIAFFGKGLTRMAKNGQNGLWKPQKWSSYAKNIWNFWFSTQNYTVKNSVPQMLKFVAACSLKSPWNQPLTPGVDPRGWPRVVPGHAAPSRGARICPRSGHFLATTMKD